MNTFNIGNFRSHLTRRGILQSNKFLVVITPPAGLSGISTRDLTLRCEQTSLPAARLALANIFRYGYGPSESTPIGITFGDITLSFLSSRDGNEQGFFNQWLNLIYSFDTSKGIWTEGSASGSGAFESAYRRDYATTVVIYMYDDQADTVVEITLIDAFPSDSNNGNVLSWQDNSAYKFNVNLTYRNYIMKTVKGLPDLL